jgi:anti-anti-sigma factor
VRNTQSTLAVDVRLDGSVTGLVRVQLDGELDITSSPLLQTVIDQVLARRTPRCTYLEIDMSGVSFADASGLSPVLMARAVMARRGGHVQLRHCRRCVLRLLRILGLDELADAS